jgi:hypothetical protein
MLQAVAASAAQAIGGGSIADMYNFQSRGKMMSIFLLGTVFGKGKKQREIKGI